MSIFILLLFLAESRLQNRNQMKSDPAGKPWLSQRIHDPMYLSVQQEHPRYASELYAKMDRSLINYRLFPEGITL